MFNEYPEAIEDYDEAIRLDPQNATVYYDRGIAHANHDRNEKAVLDFTEVIRLDPQHASAYSRRGGAYAALGETVKAKEDEERAGDLVPDLDFTPGNLNEVEKTMVQAAFDLLLIDSEITRFP